MLTKVLCFLLLSVLGLAISNGDVKFEKGIRIPLVRRKTPREEIYNAPNLEKYGISFSEFYKPKPNNRTNDSIAIYRYLDNEFYGEIVVGHPGQKMEVAFDTAWGLSWVISSKCNYWKTIGCWFHNKYDHTKSSEYKKDGRPYTAVEGKYNLTGFYSYDKISIAHVNVTNQSFVEMVDIPYTYILNKADGILGLGLKVDDYDPFFYKLLKDKKIKDPIFSIYLNRDRQSSHGGNIMLGFIEPRHIHGTNKTKDPIKYLPVDQGLYWQFSVDRIIFDYKDPHQKPLIMCENGCKAITDSSSNTIIGPEQDIEAINGAIKAKEFYMGRYTVNCETVNKLPRIDFVLGGQNFNLSGPDYVVKMSYKSITLCFSAFQPAATESEQDIWILGGAFLSQYYSIYNIDQKQIGFVKAA